MALISFGYRVNMDQIDPPTEIGGYILGYDSADGILKQKDHLGVVTLVGSGAGGPQGPPGPVGPAGLTWSGPWIATQSYSENYAVGYASASWWCISGVTGATGNDSPDIDTTHWALLAAQGSPGSQGAQGEHGLDGPRGLTGATGATGAGVTSSFYLQGTTDYSYDTTSAIYRTGSLNIGTGTTSDSRFLVSSSVGTTSFYVNEVGDSVFSNILKVSSSNRVEISATANTTGANLLTLNDGSGSIQRNFYIDRLGTTGAGISFRFSNTTFLRIDNNMITQSSGYYIFSSETPMYHGSNLSYISKQFTTGSEYRFVATSATSSTTLAFLTVPIYTIDTDWTTPANKKFSVFVPFNIGTGTASDSRFLVSSSGGTTSLVVDEKGNVGIGTASPSTTLHIYATQPGALRLEDGTQGPGKVLVSNIDGVATWTTLSSVGISGSANYIPKFTGISSLGNSRFSDNGTTGSYEISAGNGVYFLSGANTYLTLDRGQSEMSFYLGNPGITQSSKMTSTNTFALNIESVGYTSFNTGSTYSEKMRIASTGKVSIGPTFSAFTELLQVNGSVTINGSYRTIAGGRFAFSDGSSGMSSPNGSSIVFQSYSANQINDIFKFDPIYVSYINPTDNLINRVIVQEYTITANSGQTQVRMIDLSPTINKTGTASGIDRGLYINPTLTNDINKFRSIEVTNGDVLFSTTRGNVGIGLTGPSTKLHVYATQSGTFRLEDTTQGPGYVLTSDVNGVASWTSSLTGLSLLGNSEVISTAVIATASVVIYDYNSSSLWYHATASSDFTANFINLPTTDNRVLSASIVINQGLNGYIPNIVQIEGVTQSVKWPGGTQSGTSYNLDIVTFNFIRTSGTWTNVIGQVASFT